jgi:hypothetical protein
MRTRLFGAITLCVLAISAPVVPLMAQSGFVLTGGPKDRDQVLNYSLHNNRAKVDLNSMELYLPAQKLAVRQVQIVLPEGYSGRLDKGRIELLNKETRVVFPLEEIAYEKEDLTLTLSLKDPIPAGTPLSIRFYNTANPYSPGIYSIRARVLGTERDPIFRFVGVWLLSIN